jgi:hypothetical protein
MGKKGDHGTGTGSSVSDWHRRQHKKLQQRNKAARIAARDEKVLQTKNASEIREEIQRLERQYRDIQNRPHGIQNKLDRMQKELKLLQKNAPEPDQKLHKQQHHQQGKQQLPAFTKLEYPQVSIYYDPVLNPYGAPPPGQPLLFRKRGGGVTPNINEADMPSPSMKQSSENETKTENPTKRHKTVKNSNQNNMNALDRQAQRKAPQVTREAKTQNQQQQQQTPTNQSSQTINEILDSSSISPLPKPSASVGRSKRKLAADIWASQEEVEYEQRTGGVELEGVVSTAVTATDAPTGSSSKAMPSVEENSDSYFYKDTSGNVQGPFSLHQMVQWTEAGFFPHSTPIRKTTVGPWKLLSQCPELWAPNDAAAAAAAPTTSTTTAAFAPAQESSVEERIAMLRAENDASQEHRRVHEQENPVEVDTVESRIAKLRAEKNQNEIPSAESRIAALRAKQDDEMPPPPPPPSSGSNNEIQPPYPLEDIPLPPPKSMPNSEVFLSYPIDDFSYEDLDENVVAVGPYPENDTISHYNSVEENFVKDNIVFTPEAPAMMPTEHPTKKKKAQVDKAVVSLLPSKLQKRSSIKEIQKLNHY